MSSASVHPAPVSPSVSEETATRDIAPSGNTVGGNNAGYERAELRLTRALERLEAAAAAQAKRVLAADESKLQLKGENARLEAENTRLQKAQNTVETRLDAAIGRLQGLLDQEG